MWSPPTTVKDLDAGSVPYGRALPRRSKPHPAAASAAAASGYHPSPLRPASSSSSAVPFSWEHRPGIPKPSARGAPLPPRSATASILPLPPPLRSAPAASLKIKQRRAAAPAAHDDPFAAALAECAKAPPGPDINGLFARRGSAAGQGRRRASWSVSDRIGLFGLLHASSCKATCAVADSAVFVPRPGSRTAS